MRGDRYHFQIVIGSQANDECKDSVSLAEYWVVDVQQAQITAFRILLDRASQRISQSQVLLGLAIALLEEALQRSRQMDNSQVGAWFLAEVQK